MRRDPYTGIVPYISMNANTKNRYNILSTVNVKGGHVNPVEFVVLEECTNSSLFLQFTSYLLERGHYQEVIFVSLITFPYARKVIILDYRIHLLRITVFS